MAADSYFHWLTSQTPTKWWHDSSDPEEISFGLEHMATGATTNPVLIYASLTNRPEKWASKLSEMPSDGNSQSRTEYMVKTVVTNAAKAFLSEYEKTNGDSGYVCAQVDPAMAANRDEMMEMAQRFYKWAPNIAVKLPATSAGLDVLEECIAQGITVTATVSFTVPQVIAVSERHKKGIERAKKNGKKPGKCFAVIMIGRIDGYLGEVAQDQKACVSEADIRQAGLAITKRAYSIYKKQGYETTLMVAALRGTYHMEQLAGADLTMSIFPAYQKMLLKPGIPRQIGIDEPIAPEVIRKLETIPEFVRAYEPDGLKPEEFITFGVTQKTLSQFSSAGWALIDSLKFNGR